MNIVENLKTALFMQGREAIEDFLGYEIDPNEEKDVTENRLDEVIDQMPDIEFNIYCKKYL